MRLRVPITSRGKQEELRQERLKLQTQTAREDDPEVIGNALLRRSLWEVDKLKSPRSSRRALELENEDQV